MLWTFAWPREGHMKPLVRHLTHKGAVVPVPWGELDQYLQPERGQLHTVIGAPGVGKSSWALEYCLSLAKAGEPVLYVTLDTPIADQAARIIANLRGFSVSTVKSSLEHHAPWLGNQNLPLRFSDIGMGVDELDDLIEAETQWFGQCPVLMVVDNAGDLVEGEDDPAKFGKVFRALRDIALRREMVVLALHHIKRGDAADGDVRPKMSDGIYGGERPSSSVLGLWLPGPGEMAVTILKHRHGAKAEVKLPVDLSMARIG